MKRPRLSGDESDEVIAFINDAGAEIERLRAALKPFAEWSVTLVDDACPLDWPTMADLERAKAAYQQSTPEK